MALSRTTLKTKAYSGFASTHTTTSFTPPDNCLLLVRVGSTAGSNDNHGNDQTVSDSLGLTWTPLVDSGTASPSWNYGEAVFYAEVATGAAMTLTHSLTSAGGAFAGAWIEVHSFVGYDPADPFGVVQYEPRSGPTNGGATLTLSQAPASTSIVIAFAANSIGSGTGTMEPGTEWTEVAEGNTPDYHVWQSQERTGSTSTAVEWADLLSGGPTTGESAMLTAVEVRAAPDTLYSAIDEPTPDRTDYIKTNVVGAVAEFDLAEIASVKPGTSIVLPYEAGNAGGAAIKVEIIDPRVY